MSASSLTPELLLGAYAQGYFPMPHPETGEILWFNPDPRAILPLDRFHCSRSLRRRLRRGDFSITYNRAFHEVMQQCAHRPETWITPEFLAAYGALHRLGHAHSVEVWKEESLVGGVYGVTLGGAFFAESKFHRLRDMSKVALYHLVERLKEKGFRLLEVQFLTCHLKSLGAVKVPRRRYLESLRRALRWEAHFVD